MKGENISGTSVELVKIRLKKGTRKTRSDRNKKYFRVSIDRQATVHKQEWTEV